MPGIATGVFKKLFAKRQTALGVIAPAGAAGSARNIRRVTSTLDLTKATYESGEIRESQQDADMRHGVRSVGGSISGELSIGSYQMFLESVLRAAATAGGATAANTGIVTAVTGDRVGTMTRGSGSYLADGHTIGDVVNIGGYTGAAVANNHYAVIIGLTATVMTILTLDKAQVVAKAAGDGITIAAVGRKIKVPLIGHTRDYYTIEHWFGDIGESEVFTDCMIGGANINLPPTGMATVEFPIMGLDMKTAQAQYFTAPAASGTGATLAAANGVLIIAGQVAGLVTGLTIAISGNVAYPSGDGVVGSNVRPDVMPGKISVTGQMTILFANGFFRDLFLNETEASIISVFTTDNTATPGFESYVMSRVKFNGSTKDDTNTGMTQTVPYKALENVNGGPALANDQTTITVQDSAFV